MRACIHRGAHEIGGSCVEVESSGQRLVLDLGRPLDAPLDEPLPLPPVPGLADGDPALVGVVISHGHPDHFGLVEQLHPGVPLYLGEATARILRESQFFGAPGADLSPTDFLRDADPLDLGRFRITPFLVDHSAFDAYALLIEADGRRLLYSGDIRAHGRKPGTFERFLESPPTGVGALLLEGTRLGRADSGGCETELDVEHTAAEMMRQTAGLVLALFSPQNIDRYVSLFKAALRSDRTFVVDLYTATVARSTGLDSIPQASWRDVRVYVPQAQRVRVKVAKEFDRVNELGMKRIYLEEIVSGPKSFVMAFRQSMVCELERAGVPAGTGALWSMWPGYLDRERSASLREFLDRHEILLEVIHTSGHARVEDLKRFAEGVAPERVVPVHTEHPERFGELYERVEMHADGEWWQV